MLSVQPGDNIDPIDIDKQLEDSLKLKRGGDIEPDEDDYLEDDEFVHRVEFTEPNIPLAETVKSWATAIGTIFIAGVLLYAWAVGAFDAAKKGEPIPPPPVIQQVERDPIIVVIDQNGWVTTVDTKPGK